jgi:predicted nuclease of predicted toxin-antitoxin system
MARLQADEDFKASVAAGLRELGHDVQSAVQAGLANRGLPDEALLAHATAEGRVVLTHNRDDFVRLHRKTPAHGGIIVCRQSGDPQVMAQQIHAALVGCDDPQGLLIRVYLQLPPRVEGRV